jgi:hypothetical protein
VLFPSTKEEEGGYRDESKEDDTANDTASDCAYISSVGVRICGV